MVSILVDNDLLMRSWATDDAPALFRAVDESREHIRPWLPWVDETTRPEHSAAYIQHALAMAESRTALHFGIFHQQRVVGAMSLYDFEMRWRRSAAVGYWIAKNWEGRGVMQRCLSRLVDFGFDTCGLQRLEVRYAASNLRSASLVQRLGFVQEGVLRQACWREGKAEDLVVAGLLKKEFKNSLIQNEAGHQNPEQ